MAKQQPRSQEKNQDQPREGIQRHEGQTRALGRVGATGQALSPFSFMRRFSEEMDRLFEDFGFGGSLFSPTSSWVGGELPAREFGRGMWAPQIELFHRGEDLVVRADIPGVRKEDLKVEYTEDGIALEGERRQEHTEEGEGRFHTERRYGRFFRHIPLPEGVDPESARASFRDGVLEIVMKAPQAQSKARRIEIE